MGLFSNGVINSDIFSPINVAPDGHAFGSATSILIGERKEATLNQKGRVRADVIERPAFDLLDTEIDVDLFENDWQTFYDWVLMSKQGLSSWQFGLSDGTYANYVKNLGTISAPNGTWMLGTLPTYEVGDTERSIKIKAQGGGYRRLWRYMNNNTTAATGGSGGSTISGFVKSEYDMTRVAPPGIIEVLNSSGDSVPFLTTGAKLTLEPRATPSPLTPGHQPILLGFSVKIEIMSNSFDLGEFNDALETYVNEDQDWTIHLAPCENDITNNYGDPMIVLHNSVFPNPNNALKEHGGFIGGFQLNGYIPLDTPAWAGNNFNMDIATNTLTLNRVL